MLNIEKYKDEILKEYKDNLDIIDAISDSTSLGNALFSIYDRRNNDKELDIIEWLTSEYKEPILTDKEKEILKNISRRFDNIGHHIITIKKKKCFVDDGSLIFKVKIDAVHHTYSESDLFYLDKKFKGMELEKEYTLEELGL